MHASRVPRCISCMHGESHMRVLGRSALFMIFRLEASPEQSVHRYFLQVKNLLLNAPWVHMMLFQHDTNISTVDLTGREPAHSAPRGKSIPVLQRDTVPLGTRKENSKQKILFSTLRKSQLVNFKTVLKIVSKTPVCPKVRFGRLKKLRSGRRSVQF
jgi:hypothetical protein